ncbi:hypothetical protein OIV19_18240 [Brucella sp. HL-2]|nr:hypothetical protein [Brucella sp. HL-2]MCV9909543.1 hypothetical protein [Brucella sp. HL-2]
MNELQKFRLLPVIPLETDQFTVSDEDARSIVSAHISVTLAHPLPNIRASSLKGMHPYMAAVAMAFLDIGFEDLLLPGNRAFTEEDIALIEQRFPFLVCLTESMSRKAAEVLNNDAN